MDEEDSYPIGKYNQPQADTSTGTFVRVVRNVGDAKINPFLLTINFDMQIGAGLIYCYPLFGGRAVEISEIHV